MTKAFDKLSDTERLAWLDGWGEGTGSVASPRKYDHGVALAAFDAGKCAGIESAQKRAA